MCDLPPTLASMRRHDIGRNVLFIAVLLAWGGAALFALFSLGLYQKRTVLEQPALAPSVRERVTGWRLRHILTGTPRLCEAILQSLYQRGLRAGLREEIWLTRETDLSRRLRAEGWDVRVLPGVNISGSRLEIISPVGAIAWSGDYQPGDFALGPAVIWDLRVLEEIAIGRRFPGSVPAGCATPAPAAGAAAFAWLGYRPASTGAVSESL